MAREATLTPTRWTARGEAELDFHGRRTVVWSGIPGERSRATLNHSGQHMDYASWRGSRHADPHRVDPRCRRYHLCGGCPLMHLDAEGQRAARRQIVLDALAAEGQDDLEVSEVVPSPDGDDAFRWVIKLGIGYSDRGALRVGAWGRRTRTIVPIPECHVAAAPLRKVMGSIAHHVRELDIWPYDPERDHGTLRAFVVRGSRASGQVLITIVAGQRTRSLTDLAEALASDSAVVGVALHLNDDPGNAIFSRDETGAVATRQLLGRAHLDEELDGISYRIGPGDFFQTNPGMAEVLYRETLDALDLSEGVPFVDLYSGVGGFALSAARRTGWAMGVEEVDGAVRSAREAAKRNDVTAEFMSGSVVEVLPDLQRRLVGARPVVTVNPARRGLEDGVAEAILALSPRRIGYVSCNPAALGRDLAVFRAAGMVADRVVLYDMFPNTSHVESVVILRAPDEDAPGRRAPRRKTIAGVRSKP